MAVAVTNGEMNNLNSCKTDLSKLICVDFRKSEFLNINIFNWYEALYSAYSIDILISLDQFEWFRATSKMTDSESQPAMFS